LFDETGVAVKDDIGKLLYAYHVALFQHHGDILSTNINDTCNPLTLNIKERRVNVMDEDVMNTENRSILVPALISGAVGAGLALLLTPKSGSEIRYDLKRFAKRSGSQGQEALESGSSAVREGMASGQESLAEAGEQAGEFVSGGGERSILVPVLVSGVIGAAVALLFAPKRGSEVVQDIKEMAASALEKGKGLYEQGATAVKEAIEKGKEAAVEEKEKFRPAA
jgi:gas vesicle protein